MAFRVGQKVVCVDDKADEEIARRVGNTSLSGLKRGQVYIIRETGLVNTADPRGLPCVRIVEIIRKAGNDAPFWAHRFRPVVERKTEYDISIFRALLNPANHREHV